MIFGKKGSGKNTLLTKQALRYQRKGYKVFSDSEIFGTYKLDTNWIGKYDFPTNSVLMIEEAGMIWDNRNFKSFSTDVRDFFKLQRHHHIIVYLCSQSFDIDKKLRDLTDEMYLTVNIMGIFSIAKRICKSITIHNASDNNNGESFLTETYRFDFPWHWIWTYIPNYVQYFNSFRILSKNKDIPIERYTFENEQYLYSLQNNKTRKKAILLNKIQAIKNSIQDKKIHFKSTYILEWYSFGLPNWN